MALLVLVCRETANKQTKSRTDFKTLQIFVISHGAKMTNRKCSPAPRCKCKCTQHITQASSSPCIFIWCRSLRSITGTVLDKQGIFVHLYRRTIYTRHAYIVPCWSPRIVHGSSPYMRNVFPRFVSLLFGHLQRPDDQSTHLHPPSLTTATTTTTPAIGQQQQPRRRQVPEVVGGVANESRFSPSSAYTSLVAAAGTGSTSPSSSSPSSVVLIPDRRSAEGVVRRR